MIPTAEQQLHFLQKIQLLLDETSTNTTYKFALLLALTDLSVEKGDSLGTPLTLSLEQLARKFISYYWRQSLPYPSHHGVDDILKQHHGRQANIITKLITERNNNHQLKKILEKSGFIDKIAKVVNKMPLWRLQNLANGVADDFLYEQCNEGTVVSEITLRTGVAYCFRVFHSQIVNMVQGSWVRWIRNETNNNPILGQHIELNEFLFGSDRASLNQYVPLLKVIQCNKCFYCDKPINGTPEVDHFIPWSRYPIDLGHNFVLTHGKCNNDKRDLLAGVSHLANWVERNDRHNKSMEEYFEEHILPHNLSTSYSVTLWAYDKVEMMSGDVWLAVKGQTEKLTSEWRALLKE